MTETTVLLVEDRELLRTLFSELIHSYWPKQIGLRIDSCAFKESRNLVSDKPHDIYIFNLSSYNNRHYKMLEKMVNDGCFENTKIIVSSVEDIPKINAPEGVDICYCNEDKFSAECLPIMLNKSNTTCSSPDQKSLCNT